jgi:quercetin dioxygenase-like cupin family protein
MANDVAANGGSSFGTEDNPLVHPVTGERIIFRKRARETGGDLMEMNLYLGPSGFIAAAHIHPFQEERFEISGGPAMFRIGEEERLYEPGQTVVVPPGTPHVWWNPSDREITTLIQFRPALDTETFFETYFGLARDGKVNKKGLPNALQMMVLAHAYNREMQLPKSRQRMLYPLAVVLAKLGAARGYRARYEKYSGPSAVKAATVEAPTRS